MKWGTLYGPEYVNTLFRATRDNMQSEYRFICLTDDGTGLDEGIDVLPLPEMDMSETQRLSKSMWLKIGVFQKNLFDITGTVLCMDIDLVITGSLEPFFDGPKTGVTACYEWPIIRDHILFWRNRGGNTSVYKFEAGTQSQIYENFIADPAKAASLHRLEQQYVTDFATEMHYWPGDLVASFKKTLCKFGPLRYRYPPNKPDTGTSVIAFHGFPNPTDLMGKEREPDGFDKSGGYVSWVKDYWEHYNGKVSR